MEQKMIDKLKNLNLEIACTTDSLSLIQECISEQLVCVNREQQREVALIDSLYSVCQHFSRISKEFDNIINLCNIQNDKKMIKR